MDLAALHPLMAQLLCQLRRAPMPPILQHLLSDVGGALWSAVEEGLQAGIPVSLKALLASKPQPAIRPAWAPGFTRGTMLNGS